jgi:branched-chain amino acid transport system substrate-binding protein
MHNRTKFSGILMVLSVFTYLGMVTSAPAKGIKVGAVINLTGPASTWGQFHAKGQMDYFRYVNEVKGGVAGHQIDITVVDHGYRIPEAIRYVKMFCTKDKMDIINTWDAASGITTKPIFQKYGVPNINFSAHKEFLKPPIDFAYLPFGDYDMDSYAILEYIKKIHKRATPPKVGLLTYDNIYGKAIHAPSKEYAAKYNMNIVGIEQFPKEKFDLKTELLRLKNAGAGYVFMQVLPPAVILALQSADKINYDVPFFATWTATDPEFFERAKGLLRNRMFVQFCGGLPVDRTPGVKLMEELGKRYGSVKEFNISYWEGVVVGMIQERAFKRAYEKFGKINSDTINKALQTFRNEDFGGLVPNITYTNTDHSASWTARIVWLNEDQKYTPATEFWEPGKKDLTHDKIFDVPPDPPWGD